MIREVKNGNYEFNGKKNDFKFYNNMNVKEKLTFVNDVTNIVVGENYNCLIKDMVFDFYLIYHLSDINFNDMISEDGELSIDFIEDFIENTTVADEIKCGIPNNLLEELNNAVDKNIEYKTGIHNDYIHSSIEEFFNIVNSKIENIDTNKVYDVMDSLKEIIKKANVENIVNEYRKVVKKDNKKIIKNKKK